MDAGCCLALAAVAYKIIALDGGPAILGLAAALIALSSLAFSPLISRRLAHLERFRLLRYGILAGVLFATLAFQAPSLPWLLLVMPLLGLAGAFYRPWIMTRGPAQTPWGLAGIPGTPGVIASAGRVLGYGLGGFLLSSSDFRSAFLAGIGLFALSFFSVPREDRLPEPESSPGVQGPGGPSPEKGPGSWITLFITCGAAGMLMFQLPALFEARDLNAGAFGGFIAAIFLVQAIVLSRFSRRVNGDLSTVRLILMVLAALALLALPFLQSFTPMLFLALLLGASLALAGAPASRPEEQGAGLSEQADAEPAVLQIRSEGLQLWPAELGMLLFPLLGGLLAEASGWPGAPYLFGGIVMLVGAALMMGGKTRATAAS